MSHLVIREAEPADFPALRALFRGTVLTVNRRDYTREDVEDWAACAERVTPTAGPMRDQHCLVAENTARLIVGFASVNVEGYLHMLYVHRDFQRQGVAAALYGRVEAWARAHGARGMTAHVSLTAEPFFSKQGFRLVKRQQSKARHRYLANCVMDKALSSPDTPDVPA